MPPLLSRTGRVTSFVKVAGLGGLVIGAEIPDFWRVVMDKIEAKGRRC